MLKPLREDGTLHLPLTAQERIIALMGDVELKFYVFLIICPSSRPFRLVLLLQNPRKNYYPKFISTLIAMVLKD